MKKLLLICLLTIVNAYAQDKSTYFYISSGIDIKNILVGSKPTNNKSALDLTLEAHAVADNIDFGLGYEEFYSISFQRKFLSLGYHIQTGYISGTNIKCTVIPSIEWSQIIRTYNEHYSYLNGESGTHRVSNGFSAPGANLAFQLDLNKYIAIQLVSNLIHRTDMKYLYNNDKWMISNGFKLVYKFNDK